MSKKARKKVHIFMKKRVGACIYAKIAVILQSQKPNKAFSLTYKF